MKMVAVVISVVVLGVTAVNMWVASRQNASLESIIIIIIDMVAVIITTY